MRYGSMPAPEQRICMMKTPYEQRDNDSPAEVVWHRSSVPREDRDRLLVLGGCCLWLIGVSGSGKSSLANALEVALFEQGRDTYLLDADNVRHGLNKDLVMSDADRTENIRR